jgi:hypothetical protein
LAAGLGTLHQAGILHRDVKPSNVMAVPNGAWFDVKLFDFGIARLLNTRSSLTSTGICIGSPHHMAPEQILCDHIDGRTDIYALGILVYQMVTGVLPFPGANPVEVQLAQLDTPAPRASEIAPTAAPWDDALRSCMAKRPSERPTSATDVLALFRDALDATTDAHKPSALSVQIEVHAPAERWPGVDDALAFACDEISRRGWRVAAVADNAVVAMAPGGARPELIVADASRWQRQIVDLSGECVRVFVHGATDGLAAFGDSKPVDGLYVSTEITAQLGAGWVGEQCREHGFARALGNRE